MKKKKTQISPTQKDKKFKWVVLGACASVLLLPLVLFGLIKIYVLIYNSLPPEYGKKPYTFHHPALYYFQNNWISFGNKVICVNVINNSCKVFNGERVMTQINFKHDFTDYSVSNNLLYILCSKEVYVYDTDFDEIEKYEVGGTEFIVKGEYIYYTHYDSPPVQYNIYRYSMETNQNEYLCAYDSRFVNLPSERIYMSNGKYYDYDRVINNMMPYSHDIYNEKYGRISLKTEKNKIVINERSFNFDYEFEVGDLKYSGIDSMLFFTYEPCYDDCDISVDCISQLKEVKLWKYDLEKETLSLIKEFNDYTILIAFDENNYHYYYDGKLYSNDVVIEDLSFKLEVGNMFTYYARDSVWLDYYECYISYTNFSYINGEFYYYHNDYPENNEKEKIYN